MPFVEPSRSDVHVDAVLSQISLAELQDLEGFVAGRVFQGISVGKKSDLYFTFDRGDWNRNQMKDRAPGTQSSSGTYTVATTNYNCRNRGFLRWIPDEVRSNQDEVLDQDTEATLFVSQVERINREVNWASQFFVAGDPGVTWTFKADGNATATAAGSFDPTTNGNNNILFWDNPASTPIEDIRRGKRFVGEETGRRPNVMTLQRGVFDVLLDHPDIVGRLDRGQTQGPAIANKDALAALFELEEILVMDAIQNTAKKGATNAHSYIGGKHALLTYRPPAPGRMTPAAGYTFNWTGYLGATEEGTRILRDRVQLRHSDYVEIESAYDQKLTSADLGYGFDDIIENS